MLNALWRIEVCSRNSASCNFLPKYQVIDKECYEAWCSFCSKDTWSNTVNDCAIENSIKAVETEGGKTVKPQIILNTYLPEAWGGGLLISEPDLGPAKELYLDGVRKEYPMVGLSLERTAPLISDLKNASIIRACFHSKDGKNDCIKYPTEGFLNAAKNWIKALEKNLN